MCSGRPPLADFWVNSVAAAPSLPLCPFFPPRAKKRPPTRRPREQQRRRRTTWKRRPRVRLSLNGFWIVVIFVFSAKGGWCNKKRTIVVRESWIRMNLTGKRSKPLWIRRVVCYVAMTIHENWFVRKCWWKSEFSTSAGTMKRDLLLGLLMLACWGQRRVLGGVTNVPSTKTGEWGGGPPEQVRNRPNWPAWWSIGAAVV